MIVKLNVDGHIDLDQYTTQEIYNMVDQGQISEYYPSWFYNSMWWDDGDNEVVTSLDLR